MRKILYLECQLAFQYCSKEDIGKGYQNPKRKLGIIKHLLAITELKFGENGHTLFSILTLFFFECCCLVITENAWLPQFSFQIPIAFAKICFPRIVIKFAKITLYQKAPSLSYLDVTAFLRQKYVSNRTLYLSLPVRLFSLRSAWIVLERLC